MSTALPSAASVVDEAVDLLLRADVDATGGFIEEKHVHPVTEHPGEGDLLLIAAGELADGLPRRFGI